MRNVKEIMLYTKAGTLQRAKHKLEECLRMGREAPHTRTPIY